MFHMQTIYISSKHVGVDLGRIWILQAHLKFMNDTALDIEPKEKKTSTVSKQHMSLKEVLV